jgi:GNAT superfamily N-acetyltransferase
VGTERRTIDHLELRDAAVADAAELARLNTSSWKAAYAGFIPAGFLSALDLPAWERHLLARIDDADSFTVVAVSGGRYVGFVSGGPLRDEPGATGGEVYALYAAAGGYGCGVGTALLAAAEARLADAGYERAMLWVFTRNRASRRFYERRGWCQEPQRAYWVRGAIRRQLTCYAKDLDAQSAS